MAINCKLNARLAQNILYSIICPENGQSISDPSEIDVLYLDISSKR